MLRAFVVAAAVLVVVPTFAAQRQFVASNGNDVNPCSLTLPCRGFAAAATAVDPGGEIIVLDSAGYGPVTLTKSVSIISPAGIYAGISVPGGQDGITINAAGIRVRLEGLTINGTGGGTGIRLLNGSLLSVTRCQVTNMAVAGISSISGGAFVQIRDSLANNNSGVGLYVAGATRVTVDSSVFSNNSVTGVAVADGSSGSLTNVTASSNGAYGIHISAGNGWTTSATVENSEVHGNFAGGVEFGTTGNGGVTGDVSRSIVSKNQYGISAVSGGGTGVIAITAANNVITQSTFEGVIANGAGAFVVATANTISRNGAAGLQGVAGGTVYTSQDNASSFNTPNVGANVFAFGKS